MKAESASYASHRFFSEPELPPTQRDIAAEIAHLQWMAARTDNQFVRESLQEQISNLAK